MIFIAYFRNEHDKPCSEVYGMPSWEGVLQKAQAVAAKRNWKLVTLSATEINKPFNQSKGVKEMLR